jgi:hypothetical protein
VILICTSFWIKRQPIVSTFGQNKRKRLHIKNFGEINILNHLRLHSFIWSSIWKFSRVSSYQWVILRIFSEIKDVVELKWSLHFLVWKLISNTSLWCTFKRKLVLIEILSFMKETIELLSESIKPEVVLRLNLTHSIIPLSKIQVMDSFLRW